MAKKKPSPQPSTLAYTPNVWQDDPAKIEGGAGWWMVVGIVVPDKGKPFGRIARGKPTLTGDNTNCPVKQAQKVNIKSARECEELIAALQDLLPELQALESA